MKRTLLSAKLHRVRATAVDLDYEGSCGIDEELLLASGMQQYEHVHIYNINNGERFTTYIIKAPRGSSEISLNGAAARKVLVGDLLIIAAYRHYDEGEAHSHKPVVVQVDARNRVTTINR